MRVTQRVRGGLESLYSPSPVPLNKMGHASHVPNCQTGSKRTGDECDRGLRSWKPGTGCRRGRRLAYSPRRTGGYDSPLTKRAVSRPTRASRPLHFEPDRSRFILARAAMRKILGRYVKAAPQTLVFSSISNCRRAITAISEQKAIGQTGQRVGDFP